MRIVSLQAENFKRLSAVEITPDGNLVQITGRNGMGKSSVLDAIWAALGGKDHIQSVPVRKGAETALVKIDLGDIKVTRTFTAETGATTLKVENADGARYPSPQKMLDGLLGALAFDPLEFSRMQPAAQAAQLRALVKLDVDIDALDAANATDFATRTETNRESKRLRAQIAGLGPVPDGLPVAPIDTAALVDEIARAGEHNAGIERRKENRAAAEKKIADNRAAIDETKRKIVNDRDTHFQRLDAIRTEIADQMDALQARLKRTEDEMDAAIQRVDAAHEAAVKALEDESANLQSKLDAAPALPDPIDAAEVRARLETATATNEVIKRRTERETLEAAAGTSENTADSLTNAIAERVKQKADAIAAANMPVPGLGFGDGIVTFNGLPFDQASSAEQLRVSCAIAMAANPKLRVLRIKDGSLLDEDGLVLLASMAADNDWQVWIERVASGDGVGILIEDGHVAGAEPVEQAAE